jgi:hypothetical protein
VEEVSVYVKMVVSMYGYDVVGGEHAQHSRRRRRRDLQNQSDETPLWVTQLGELGDETGESTSGTGTSEYFWNDIRAMPRPRERIWMTTNVVLCRYHLLLPSSTISHRDWVRGGHNNASSRLRDCN